MTKRLRIGVLYSRVRVEEKWIFASIERRGLDTKGWMTGWSISTWKSEPWRQYDAILERSISYTQWFVRLRIFNIWASRPSTRRGGGGCGDKLITTARWPGPAYRSRTAGWRSRPNRLWKH